jgi:hypothetical protein
VSDSSTRLSQEVYMTKEHQADRRSFLRTGAIAGTALVAGATLAEEALATGSIPQGDIDILRLLAAAEILETDLWEQYNELGGIQDKEEPSGSGNSAFTKKLKVLDGDMDQYVHDNTDDELSHATFINAFLVSIGAQPVNLDPFRTLAGSQATGANKTKKRLTNLFELTIDTSYWTRYRSRANNPDLDPNFHFPQAIPGLTKGQFKAIPKTDADTTSDDHIQAIANTAAFHFASIEQGGTSLYPTLALRVTNVVVLRILLSIGPTETMHFQTWQDKAGNAPPLKDPITGLVFPDLNSPPFGGETFQTNLIMPEPCPFLDRKFPVCSIIRPVSTDPNIFGAVAAVTGLAKSGLFIGQSAAFFAAAIDLAKKADAATRKC